MLWNKLMRLMRTIVPVLMILVLSGCMRSKRDQITFLQKEYMIKNSAYRMSTHSIIRVVVLPLANYSADITNKDLKMIDKSFAKALLKAGRFECIFENSEAFSYTYPKLPYKLFEQLSEKYDADAVMILGITDYSPYTPIKIGVKGELVELSSGKIIWGIDELFDGSREDVLYGIRSFRRSHDQQIFESLDQLGQLSPRVFSVYVGEKICKTIPESF